MIKVNEIFCSIQGEGFWSGTAAVFVRLSGCNLRCDFCDTDFSGYSLMTIEQIVDEVEKYGVGHVVLTGGEPTLQPLDELVAALLRNNNFVQFETNGTQILTQFLVDSPVWITLSPKDAPVRIQRHDELKVVYRGQDITVYDALADSVKDGRRFVQPCDYGDRVKNEENVKSTVEFILANPRWRMSLQTHKLINIP